MSCDRFALVVGRELPAMSVSYDTPMAPGDSGFMLFLADFDPGRDTPDTAPLEPMCLDCLLDMGGEQLGRGLDLARRAGQADFDVEASEWFVPPPEEHWQTPG
jgi:hypothetical protein